MNTIEYFVNRPLTVKQVCDVYDRSGIKRPTTEPQRMERMLKHANLLVSAWMGSSLVGVARAFADYGWVCYLADLAVDQTVQHSGIGRELIARVQQEIGPESQLVLLAAPGAMGYYPKVGFVPIDNGWVIKRSA